MRTGTIATNYSALDNTSISHVLILARGPTADLSHVSGFRIASHRSTDEMRSRHGLRWCFLRGSRLIMLLIASAICSWLNGVDGFHHSFLQVHRIESGQHGQVLRCRDSYTANHQIVLRPSLYRGLSRCNPSDQMIFESNTIIFSNSFSRNRPTIPLRMDAGAGAEMRFVDTGVTTNTRGILCAIFSFMMCRN